MKEKQKNCHSSLLLLVFCFNLFVFPSNGQSEQKYQLRLSTSVYSNFLFPIQTFPITVSFELENISNKTFNGKATLEVKTEKHSWTTKTFQIINLTKGEVYKNATSYATDDEGRYWATLKLEANDLSPILLYEGSTLKDNASRVGYTDSIYLYSLTITVAIAGVIVAVIGIIVAYRKRRK